VQIDAFPDLPRRDGGTFAAFRVTLAPSADAPRQLTILTFKPTQT
jgi:hypothetical protein